MGYIGRSGANNNSHCDHLKFALYDLWNYVKEEKKQVPPYNELNRAGVNLRGLMRISLFKRFESSVEAFRTTVGRMITSHSAFVKIMDKGIIPAGEEASKLLIDADQFEERALVDALKLVSGRYNVEDFEVERLRQRSSVESFL